MVALFTLLHYIVFSTVLVTNLPVSPAWISSGIQQCECWADPLPGSEPFRPHCGCRFLIWLHCSARRTHWTYSEGLASSWGRYPPNEGLCACVCLVFLNFTSRKCLTVGKVLVSSWWCAFFFTITAFIWNSWEHYANANMFSNYNNDKLGVVNISFNRLVELINECFQKNIKNVVTVFREKRREERKTSRQQTL